MTRQQNEEPPQDWTTDVEAKFLFILFLFNTHVIIHLLDVSLFICCNACVSPLDVFLSHLIVYFSRPLVFLGLGGLRD